MQAKVEREVERDLVYTLRRLCDPSGSERTK
ncbi:hypothetical protein MXAN_6197 [Myxococcus xanthus DK 1622]|uniref:Uncharacterized protein n=1 Tax=Myxococcus xanthus (strain DK1622) TaxID=246197 RepID=Q1CZ45_MYXXD|nr:hypothetical protein MXAN_6197 [Myxococcus xanthus DK 1622]